MYDPVNFLSAFDLLCDELEPGRRLSDKLLPSLEPGVLFANMRSASCTPSHPIRSAVAAGGGTDLAGAVADVLPAETLRGILDGVGVVCLCMAWLLFEHDADAVSARECALRTPSDEFGLVVAATDTNPIGDDPDSVQVALLKFLQNEPLDQCVADLAIAAYGRAEAYGNGDRRALIRVCHSFLSEVYALLKHNETLNVQVPQPAPAVQEKPHVTEALALPKPSAKKPPLPRTNSGGSPKNTSPVGSRPASPAFDAAKFTFTPPPLKIDRSTSPIRDMFYALAGAEAPGVRGTPSSASANVTASSTARAVSPSSALSSPLSKQLGSFSSTSSTSRPSSPAAPGSEPGMFDLIAALNALSASDSDSDGDFGGGNASVPVTPTGGEDDEDAYLRRVLLSSTITPPS